MQNICRVTVLHEIYIGDQLAFLFVLDMEALLLRGIQMCWLLPGKFVHPAEMNKFLIAR